MLYPPKFWIVICNFKREKRVRFITWKPLDIFTKLCTNKEHHEKTCTETLPLYSLKMAILFCFLLTLTLNRKPNSRSVMVESYFKHMLWDDKKYFLFQWAHLGQLSDFLEHERKVEVCIFQLVVEICIFQRVCCLYICLINFLYTCSAINRCIIYLPLYIPLPIYCK